MDPINKVKINYFFKKDLKGNVTRSQGGVPRSQPPRGGTRNKKSIMRFFKDSVVTQENTATKSKAIVRKKRVVKNKKPKIKKVA